MYFKQIEMTGFKSFADRTTVELEPGMTAVVGPNGCGKSNILDAMRWVLGEQSAKALRGTHMQDVIFNGSEERTATGMAEVTMVFDNADGVLPIDFSEVQITRRVYRSGESEYLINKAPCRMRDIQELFMDTGIGTNAYSMIGQGKISLVLSSKPEDRRFLFEEAAGIIKYKARKKVALRRLDQAEQNLLRLGDIISEVQRQMRSLKRQVNAAIRHRELTEQLRELEIRASWLKHTLITQTIATLRENFHDAQNTYERESAEMTQLEARHEELSMRKLETDRVLHARRESVHEIENEMEKLERQIALIQQQIVFSDDQREGAETERKALIERAEAIEAERTETAETLESLQRDIAETEQQQEAKQLEHDEAGQRTNEADMTLEAARSRAVESMGLRAKTQTAIETLTVGLDNIEAQLTAIYERQTAEIQRKEELISNLEELRKTEGELQVALDGVQKEVQESKEEQTRRASEMETLNEQWQAQRESLSSVQARLTSLRELRDRYEGFAAGVRAVMKAKGDALPQMAGVIGPVGDLISTNPSYERAVEAALGGSINNIAVDTAATAKAAVAYLKENQAGRVTFLPLDLIRAREDTVAQSLRDDPGVIGQALDLVEFEERLEPALRYLLGNTVFVKTIDDAIRLAGSERRTPRLVTLDGEVVSASGAVTGGRTRHDSRGLLGRSAEIGELKEQSARLESGIETLSGERQTLGETLSALDARLTELGDQESDGRGALNELIAEMGWRNTELTNLGTASEERDRERDTLSAKRDTLEAQRREATQAASDIETKDESLQREIAEAQEMASRTRQAQSVLASELSDLRVQFAHQIKSREETERDLERQDQDRAQAIAEADRRRQTIEEIETNRVTLEGNIADHTERSKALSESKETARVNVIEAENERQAQLDESETIEAELKERRERLRTNQSTVHQLELDLRHNEDQQAFFEERILSEYNIALGSLRDEEVGTDDYDDETREQLVQETRTKLERMGTVNLMAIEEYEALTERNDFLVTQENDLSSARESLLKVVARIDETITTLFLDTFNAVSNTFREYFRRLFNGGHARIYLLDEDDPLECGIEIEARPPGKQPQTISLLSGGEQAMTAIALLFSIFKAKPSPFCVLDEVDAPLDDANIGRFLTMVEEFAVHTQFIVITHNKQTMAKADVLYGVTMQERGVSQMVSVKFDTAHDTSAELSA